MKETVTPPASLIVTVTLNERRRVLCKDNRLRRHAFFGDPPECVKSFKTWGWAKRAAWKAYESAVRQGATGWCVHLILPGETLNDKNEVVRDRARHRDYEQKAGVAFRVSTGWSR